MLQKLKQSFFTNKDSGKEHEKVHDKSTTKLGYIMLIIMFCFLVWVGQSVFADLQRTVEKPERTASCVSNVKAKSLTSYLRCDSSSKKACGCSFTNIDLDHGLDTKLYSIQSTLEKITSVNKQIRNNLNQARATERAITKYERQYELSLQKKSQMKKFYLTGQSSNLLWSLSVTNYLHRKAT